MLEYILLLTVFYILSRKFERILVCPLLWSLLRLFSQQYRYVTLSLSLCIVVYNVTLSPRLDEPVGYFLEPPVRVKVSESSRRNFQGLEAHLFTLSVNLWAGAG